MDDNQMISPVKIFAPMVIALVALAILVAGQAWAAFDDHGVLLAVRDGQANGLQQSAVIRQRLTVLAGGVAQLAQSGNADAQSIVSQFAKNGIKFSPSTESIGPNSNR